jgi:(R,R)-butanediol dehydrogenase/meso-butanediol dehydrogenase/diacetyl reductase
MQAALITGRQEIEFREFPEPIARPGTAVLRVDACGICGTDVAAYRSGQPYLPFLCGHEWTGTILEIRSDATGKLPHGLHEGDRAVMGVPVACGQCAECRAGLAHRCAGIMALGYGIHPLTPPHGGYAPRIAVPSEGLVSVPSELSIEEAAQVEPATVALHAVRRRGPRLGERVLVLGAGPIGLYALQLARIAGAGEVYVLEPQASRRAIAESLGATRVFAPGDEATEVIRERCGGLGVDLVYECSGAPAAIDSAFALLRPGGALMLIGVSEHGVHLDPLACITKEIVIDNSSAHQHHEFGITMDLIRDGRLRTGPIHSRTLPLDRIVEGFDSLLEGEEAKILIAPANNAK